MQKENQAPNYNKSDQNMIQEEKKFRKNKIPGMLTKNIKNKSTIDPELQIQQFLKKHEEHISADGYIIQSLQEIVNSLIQKNDKLVQERSRILHENEFLKKKVQDLEYQIDLLKNRSILSPQTSIFTFLEPTAIQPVILEMQGQKISLGNNFMKCKVDNHSNTRAFYLSMLQYEASRLELTNLAQQLKIDQTYKVLPLLETNQFWISITSNFIEIIESNSFVQLTQLYHYINSCSLLDLIFISSLRSRVQFLTTSYDSQIETIQLYTSLANTFNLNFKHELTPNYEIFKFSCESYQFQIILNDVNQYCVQFIEAPKSLLLSNQISMIETESVQVVNQDEYNDDS